MKDKYRNFADLHSAEPPGAYMISVRDACTACIIAPPHGGGIEQGTSEITLAIAGSRRSYYLFEGVKSRGNKALHITSANFDEPAGFAVMRRAQVVVTVHGEKGDDEVVYIGGLNASLKSSVRASLEPFGYVVNEHSNPLLQGLHVQNICNIGVNGAGLQLELTEGLRASFFKSLTHAGRKKPTARLFEFSRLVADALRKNAL